jgi:ATP-dependent DNA helicase RecG
MLAEYIDQAVSCQAEYLPARIYAKAGQIPYGEALDMVHRPASGTDFCKGRDRLLFDEMLFFYLSLKASNDKGSEDSSLLFEKKDLMQSFIESLPFPLTAGQKAVTDRIAQTGMSGKRCNFLIQGDVGCGKTVVAIAAMFAAYENGMQSVLMAPRAVLARQHYEEVKKYADQFGITCVFLDSKIKSKEKWKAYEMISSGEAGFIVGTHSCVSEAVEYNRLGLVVTDEEHLFGVNQKEALQERASAGVHSISMSATPIPRSLASVLYGEKKEICIIKDKPAGRKPVITRAGSGRENVFPFLEKQIRAGRQCYVVCPAIEESDDQENPRAIVSIKAVASEYKEYFEPKGIGIGFVDGKKKPEEIKKTMKEFAENRLQILISTTVIEVGVNVPNATVMVVEQADVFGLASLHQLRGRVGRSSLQSYCFLLSEEPDNERLQTMCSTNDGFEIAEADLRQRGTGNLIGTEQAGMNRFVTTMLDNPLLYQSVKKFADENISDIQAAAILLSSPLRSEGEM